MEAKCENTLRSTLSIWTHSGMVVRGQGGGGASGGGAGASAATDPSAPLTQLQFQNLFNFETYDASGYANTAIVQPVLPFPVFSGAKIGTAATPVPAAVVDAALDRITDEVAAVFHRIGPRVASVLFQSLTGRDHESTISRVTGRDLEMYSCCRDRTSVVSAGS